MKLVRFFLNEEQYKEFCREAERNGFSLYGLAKFSLLAFLKWYGEEMSENIPIEEHVKRFLEWYGKEMRKDIQLFKEKS